MPDAAWDEDQDAAAMLHRLRGVAGVRKLRLFACACARARWSGLVLDACRASVEIAERYADGQATDAELEAACEEVFAELFGVDAGDSRANFIADRCAHHLVVEAAASALGAYSGDAAAMVREIFADPSMRLAALTRDEAVLAVARQIYEARDFARLPELADLLVAAGCTHAAALAHLRGPGPHFRGCWALDAVLGKGQGAPVFTETQWYTASRPFVMLHWWGYLREPLSPRKLRLLAVACCRLRWRDLARFGLEQAVETAEEFADDLVDLEALQRAHESAQRLRDSLAATLGSMTAEDAGGDELKNARQAGIVVASLTDPDPRSLDSARYASARDHDDAGQAELIREILGNPFKPARIAPSWLTWRNGAIVELARAIYQKHDFVLVPRLADQLRAAGCRDSELLEHLQQNRGHVRGCWALDAILGKQ
ncbi:hypothetical protein OV203_38090 [Nannocystis sp. ILAH1]|uniref:hypothetical protein n=1 Tax=Nannocystis sp. ILAH1 TaxID=2996789 RepID=UPI00226EAAD4|nr:hypothetical protein [Nannocystis sp. ILAH1]MCY0993015.1 hypothetical protein [Nannocystis sp. ILAH1]